MGYFYFPGNYAQKDTDFFEKNQLTQSIPKQTNEMTESRKRARKANSEEREFVNAKIEKQPDGKEIMKITKVKRKISKTAAKTACERSQLKALDEIMSDDYVKPEKCTVCDGTGVTKMKMAKMYPDGRPPKNTETEIKCTGCNGEKKMSDQTLFKNLCSKHLWCKCGIAGDPVYADDGKIVFGNDTYVCSQCEMVVQFG